ncbi:coiled-coil domain-containing protein 17 [Chanos chanos]|uniref:Coiled-coil domain-containing protein 17 n=1 Tax=Chanos chanos TaxID=29144 RepID=A0A6J2WQA4_CHACN|nr:coiled-coil domain-containing protein 17 [Chanos chanos]
MEVLGDFHCRDCKMVFHSAGLLQKHKARFCIGSDIGDPVLLHRGRVEFRVPGKTFLRGVGGLLPRKTRTPDLIHLREQQSKLGGVPDGDSGCEPGHVWEESAQISGADSLAFRKLTDEVKRLRMSVEESMSSPPKPQSEGVGGPTKGRDKVQEAWDQHERQLAEIRSLNSQLEQQKHEIERRLAALAEQGSVTPVGALLQELKELEKRNEETLIQIGTQITSMQGPREADVPTDSPEDRKPQHITFDLTSSVDGPLSAQIRSLRLAYLQAGGTDPQVLAQMHDFQAEAQTLEQTRPIMDHKTRRKRMKPQPPAMESEVLAVEQENRRLEEEIFRAQLARERHRGEGGSGTDLQRNHLYTMASLLAEISSLRREVERSRERRRPPPPPPPFFSGPLHPQTQLHPLLEQTKQSYTMRGNALDPADTLGPAPYDPAAGFVLFYDLVVGVDASLAALCLVAGLYLGGQELGWPTPLPPVECQPARALSYPHGVPPGNYAILSMKQPVPRMQPSPSLSLVVEVQGSGASDRSAHVIQNLVPRGWAQMELFDQHNRVLSGFWKVPFRVLPLRPSLSPAQLNSVPQLGNMELCLRIVNARDADTQSLAKIDPNDIGHYKYHPMVLNHTEPEGQSAGLSAAQLPANPSLSPSDHTGPPPTEETAPK